MKKKSRTIEAKKGEWYLLVKGSVIQECCFCSLAHRLEAMIVRGKIPKEDKVAIRWFPHK
jgi:hypothetical protein